MSNYWGPLHYCASTSPRAPTLPSTPRPTCRRSRTASTIGHGSAMAGERPPRCMPNSSGKPAPLLRPPVEFAPRTQVAKRGQFSVGVDNCLLTRRIPLHHGVRRGHDSPVPVPEPLRLPVGDVPLRGGLNPTKQRGVTGSPAGVLLLVHGIVSAVHAHRSSGNPRS